MSTDIKLTITGFKSVAEAEAFAEWYSGQGEQDASIWFEEREEVRDFLSCRKIERVSSSEVRMEVDG